METALAMGLAASLAVGGAGCGAKAERSRLDTLPSQLAGRTTLGVSTANDASTAAPSSRRVRGAGGAMAPEGAPEPSGSAPAAPRPAILEDPIPFGPRRRAEMLAYAVRHYGLHTYRLIHPHVIVVHYTQTADFASTFNTFAPDVPDSDLHELPNTCAHFVVDRDGTIRQLVPLEMMCRHTVGLNWTAIGIEHVGFSDAQVLGDRAQMRSSLRLVRWLRCRYAISLSNVIGHNESLSSPFHHERVAALRTQTHDDFAHADMQVYRRRLRVLGGCG